MTLSTAAPKDPQACDVCCQSHDCKRLRRCVKYKCKFGEGPPQKTYTTPPKNERACASCAVPATCQRLDVCVKHKAKFGSYEAP